MGKRGTPKTDLEDRVGGVGAPRVLRRRLSPAKVYRDEHGVPHIEADTEEAAWHAMGVEQAKDQLYLIQIAVKMFRGEAAKYLGAGAGNTHVLNDFAVQVMQLYLTGEDVQAALQSSSHVAGGAKQDQLYRNLRYYASGINAYRRRLADTADSQLSDSERKLKELVAENHHPWVLEHDVDVADVASWGRWLKGRAYLAVAGSDTEGAEILKHIQGGGSGGGSGPAPAPTGKGASWVDAFLRDMPGGGSNAFGWSFPYTQDPDGKQYACCVADPHAGPLAWASSGKPEEVRRFLERSSSFGWFCHLVVPGEDGEPGLNALGYVHPASGVIFSGHNEHVAYGGSAAAVNIADSFVVRVEDPSGQRFYSYYDGAPDAPAAYFDVVSDPVTVTTLVADGASGAEPEYEDLVIPVDRLGPFGFCAGSDVVYAKPDPSFGEWLQGAAVAEVPVPGWVPARVTYRCPADPRVDSSSHHSRLAAALYAFMRAESVHELREVCASHDPGYAIYFCSVDSAGRLFSTALGSVPRRGDDAQILTSDYAQDVLGSFGWSAEQLAQNKLFLYSKDDGTPRRTVPALVEEHRMLDWQWEDGQPAPSAAPGAPAGRASYLKPQRNAAILFRDYLPYQLFDPLDPAQSNPAIQPPGGGAGSDYENPGFATVSNDLVWLAYKKSYEFSGDNELFNQTVEAATGYHVTGLRGQGALEKTKNIVDRLSDVFLGEAPPLTRSESLDFALWTRLYIEREYAGPDGDPLPTTAEDKELPVAVRVLQELVHDIDGIREGVRRDLKFFADLWSALFQPEPGSDWESYLIEGSQGGEPLPPLSLKELWVDRQIDIIPWYPTLDPPGPGGETLGPMELDLLPGDPVLKAQYAMPVGRALIDFLWTETKVGEVRMGDAYVADDGGLSDAEVDEVRSLMQVLALWTDAPENPESDPFYRSYAIDRGSPAAALYATYELGFNAGEQAGVLNYEEGLRWCPIHGDPALSWVGYANADVTQLLSEDGSLGSLSGVLPLTADGGLPVELADDGKTIEAPGIPTVDGKILLNFVRGYGSMRFMAFPESTFGSMSSTSADGVFNDIVEYPLAPHDALYDPVTGEVKRELAPADVNALTRFFLQLGRFFRKEADQTGGGGPSLKMALAPEAAKPGEYPDHYPLTRSMAKLAVLRRLLEAGRFLKTTISDPLPSYGQIFRSRTHDLFGNLQELPSDGPDPVFDVEADGGVLRAPGTYPDIADQDAVTQLAEGYQQRMWNVGGSTRPIVTFFPKPESSEEPPDSYFWNLPGQALSGGGVEDPSAHVADMVLPFARRGLRSTHFADYSHAPLSPDNPTAYLSRIPQDLPGPS